MKTFNTKRFGHTLLWQAVSHKRFYTQVAAGGLLVVLVPALFHLVNNQFEFFVNPYSQVKDLLPVFTFIWLITGGAFIVNDLPDKRSRISTFMLPASRLEKFVSRYVSLMVFIPLAAAVGVVAGDLLQMQLYRFTVGITGSYTSVTIKELYRWFLYNPNRTEMATRLILLWLVHSVFLLVGSCFRRHAWIKTSLLLMAAAIVLSLATIFGIKALLDTIYSDGYYSITFIDAWWVDILEWTGMAVVIVFNYRATFRLYSRMQAVNNKWYNF